MDGYLDVKQLVSRGNVRFEADGGLLASVQEHGVLVPIEAYRLDGSDTWYVHDGHRRVTAAILAHLTQVPYVEVQPPADEKTRIIQQVVINQHRQGLSKLEIAENYRVLREQFGMAQKDIAETYGVTEAEVSIALAAINAAPEIRDAILDGRVAFTAMRPVLALEPELQQEIAPAVIRAKTVRAIDGVVKTFRASKGLERGIRAPKVTQPASKKVDPMETIAADAIQTALSNLRLAESAIITEPALQAKALEAIQKILDVAKRLEKQLLTTDLPVEEVEYVDVDEWEKL